MTLQQLRYIIKIVECGSITEAAKLFLASKKPNKTELKNPSTPIPLMGFHG